jgi:hypothetical protein
MAIFDTRLQFDWLGRSQRRSGLGQALTAGFEAGRRERLQRDVAEARNVLEMMRQQEQTRQFEKRHQIDKARVGAYTAQIDLYTAQQKNAFNTAQREAGETQVLQDFYNGPITQAETPQRALAIPIPKGLSLKSQEAALDFRNEVVNQLSRRESKTYLTALKAKLSAAHQAMVNLMPEAEQPHAILRLALKEQATAKFKEDREEAREAESELRKAVRATRTTDAGETISATGPTAEAARAKLGIADELFGAEPEQAGVQTRIPTWNPVTGKLE